jgi:uncharacterized protein
VPQAVTSLLFPSVLALNNDHAEELSLLNEAELAHLLGEAFYAKRVGDIDAFLIALDQDADYSSPNFLWHKARAERFVYVDRIVVAGRMRGRGLARSLYEDLFHYAMAKGHRRIGCEVNAQPPNPASDAFHGALGFKEAGMAPLNEHKIVRYYVCDLPPQGTGP